MSDVRITMVGHVGVAEICRAPHNYFDRPLITDLATAFEAFDADPACRCVVLASEGRNFCAGAAVGGGLGLALVGDFRVASAASRFTANFNRLGFHPGFGISITLPRVVGPQRAALLLYTGRRIGGEEAHAMGLVDVLAPEGDERAAALTLATEIAQSAPLAVMATRQTLRQGLSDAIAAITDHELAEQERHFATSDFAEGVRAMAARRPPVFEGR